MTGQSNTVTVPFTIRKRGGRKLILTPDGTPASPPIRYRPDGALIKALARGFRWQKMLREGDYQTLEEIADAENINPSYVSRLLRMTLLAPAIVEAILAGNQPAGLTRAKVMQPFPVEWMFQIGRINLSDMVQAEDSNLQKRFWNRASRNETAP